MSAQVELFKGLPEEEQALAMSLLFQRKLNQPPAAAPVYVDLVSFFREPRPPREYLVEGLLGRGHLAMLGGRPKSGKSWLALQLARAANSVENPPLESWRTLLDVAYAPGAIRRFAVGSQVLSVDITPDGQPILTGSEDGHVRLWDAQSGTLLLDLVGHMDAVNAVTMSPDGRHALSGSADKTVVLWDISSGERIRTLTGHDDGVSAVSFVAGGLQALSGEDSGTLPGEMIAWDLADDDRFQIIKILV